MKSGGTISTSGSTVGVTISGTATLDNAGTIQQTGTRRPIDSNTTGGEGIGSDGSNGNAEAIAMGGGSITNTATGRIFGQSTAANADASRPGSGILVDNSSGAAAVAATTIDNAGLIQGESGAAVKITGTLPTRSPTRPAPRSRAAAAWRRCGPMTARTA